MGWQRYLLLAAAWLVTWIAACGPSHAADWPSRPITMVVPFAAGGVYDTLGRVYAAALSDKLGAQVIVENVPGSVSSSVRRFTERTWMSYRGSWS